MLTRNIHVHKYSSIVEDIERTQLQQEDLCSVSVNISLNVLN
jgi:hypothetical protein